MITLQIIHHNDGPLPDIEKPHAGEVIRSKLAEGIGLCYVCLSPNSIKHFSGPRVAHSLPIQRI